MAKKPYAIISVGGSIIVPPEGIDASFIKKFCAFWLQEIAAGGRFVFVVGGGATARAYQQAARELGVSDAATLDWIGIDATVINAKFVQRLFGKHAAKELIIDPRQKSSSLAPLHIAAGWKPGRSTDYQAVCLAKTYGVKQVINLSNIAYVYDADPRQNPRAQPIRDITWKIFRRDIVGTIWQAGKNAPFDPIASKEAQKLGVTVAVVNGKNLTEVKNAIHGRSFTGTLIH